MSIANQPIHPTPVDFSTDHHEGRITMAHSAGMTLRQYYAGVAMQGMAGREIVRERLAKVKAKAAVEWADALIAALEE